MGFVRVSGYNEDDMAQARAAATAAEKSRIMSGYTNQYTYPAGSTGGTVNLLSISPTGEPYYRDVNASNVYNKGKSDGYAEGDAAGYSRGYSAACTNIENQFISPDLADIKEGGGTSYRNFIFGTYSGSTTPWSTGQNYTNSFGIEVNKQYLFILSSNAFDYGHSSTIETYNCEIRSYNYYQRHNAAGNSRVVYLVVKANSNTIGFRGNKEADGSGVIVLGYRISP